jgi:hypothetical protein
LTGEEKEERSGRRKKDEEMPATATSTSLESAHESVRGRQIVVR